MESAVHFQGPPHGKSLPWKQPNNHPYPESGGITGLFCTGMLSPSGCPTTLLGDPAHPSFLWLPSACRQSFRYGSRLILSQPIPPSV